MPTIKEYNYSYEDGRIVRTTECDVTLDSSGLVTKKNLVNSILYYYDALGQLLTETVNGSAVNTMTYDSYGNIRTKNGIAYTYGDSVWKDKLTKVGTKTITYDAQGNPTSYLGHTLTWEKGRQLKQLTKSDGTAVSYTYNANGIRTSKTVGGTKHTYTLDGTKILSEVWGSNTLIPLYDNEDSVCGVIYNNTPYYFYKNQQGDIIEITDRNAAVVARYTYDAWGKVTAVKDANGTTITSTTHIANVNPYRYRGYYYDVDTKLYYLQSRYYDPEVGRFVNLDGVIDNRSELGTNLFTYGWNNPVNVIDSSGYYVKSLSISSYLISLLGGALANIMSGISASVKSIKAAISSSWLIPVCVAATAIAIVGIVATVKKVVDLTTSAKEVIEAVKAKVKKGGVNPNSLKNYTVYVIVRKRTVDVVYVGITKNYTKRKNAHTGKGKRFPTSKFTMMPIATGLTKKQARAMEQTIITAYTLDTLVNMINSISPKKWDTCKSEFEQMKSLIDSWKDPE